jgi:ABC-type uncharacterized transport system substrate-binding protein
MVSGGILGGPLAAEGQDAAQVYRIGFLVLLPIPDHDALLNRLRELGYIEGRNLAIERRNADGDAKRLADLAADLVRLKVNVIVAQADAGARAAKNASPAIPVVFVTLGDPVNLGLVASLARPGGNLTGLSLAAPEMGGKHLELLKEATPTLTRVAVLTNPGNRTLGAYSAETRIAARRLGVQVQFVEARGPADLDQAFAAMNRERAGALIVQSDPMFFGQRERIVELANRSRLPAIYTESVLWARAGGLMAYGPSLSDMYRRAADYVDKILHGARPTDLPIERPTKFELAINLKTAKALRLTIPPTLLLQADQVIE